MILNAELLETATLHYQIHRVDWGLQKLVHIELDVYRIFVLEEKKLKEI